MHVRDHSHCLLLFPQRYAGRVYDVSILLNPQLIIYYSTAYSTALGGVALTVRIVSCILCGSLLTLDTPTILAIDGRRCSGKMTLASRLQQHLDCNVVHMDEFFLRTAQRTLERLSQPGGNVDWERFADEVLAPLQSGIVFSYRPFDCHTMDFLPSVAVPQRR